MDKFLEINNLTLAIFGISIFGIFKYFYDRFVSFLRQEEERRNNFDNATIAILHNKIYKYGLNYIDRGYITVGELQDMEQMYEPYRDLGGNGTARLIMENVKSLPIRKSEVMDKFIVNGDDKNVEL